MADDFNQEAARRSHYEMMDKLVWAKDRIAKTTDYYYNYPPTDADHQKEIIDSARQAAREAMGELDRVLQDLN